MDRTRRSFLEHVGQGVLLAGLGSQVSSDLGLCPASAADGPAKLTFGTLEPLVDTLATTPPAKLLPLLADRLKKGTSLKDLVGATALANARRFGGQDYIGFHTMMALSPSLSMSAELPESHRALPVFKVLYRNSSRIEAAGGKDVLLPVEATPLPKDPVNPEAIRNSVRRRDVLSAEQSLVSMANASPDDALNQVLCAVEDDADVHRVVMAYRSWDMLDLLGKDMARVMLRQSVRYCIQQERPTRNVRHGDCRAVLPKMLEKHGLMARTMGKRTLDDAALTRLSREIYSTTPEQAAGLAAEALAEGISPDALGEAISLAACDLVLRDPGRAKRQVGPGKPEGSVHGDSTGVHSCDSVNAWRNLARVANARNAASCLILAAFHVAQDRNYGGEEFLRRESYPMAAQREKVKTTGAVELLREAEGAIRGRDQAVAAAAVHRYLEKGYAEKDAFALMLRYAVSEDGALHAEKFYRTAREEYGRTRAAFRGRYLVALARVTASMAGQPAPGYAEACRVLGV